MAEKCCDGTGWTGEEGVICHAHYNQMGDILEMLHFDIVE